MTTNLYPNYAHWAAGAAFALALLLYVTAWSFAGVVLFVFGLVFEAVAWSLLLLGRRDGDHA